MTPAQIDLVKNSWRRANAVGVSVVELFYAKLFELDPDLQELFLNNMPSQHKKFDNTLTAIIEHLDAPDVVSAKIQLLGTQHAGYGVKNEHYWLVEQALIGALKDSLAGEFDSATEHAWETAYRAVADLMIAADIDAVASYPS